jgi:hypothetical protein
VTTIDKAIAGAISLDDTNNYDDCGDAEEAIVQAVQESLGIELDDSQHHYVASAVEDWWNANPQEESAQ